MRKLRPKEFIHLTNFFFCLFFGGTTPVAYGSSQARDRIGAAAASLHHSHSNARSKPRLGPTPAHSSARSLTHWAGRGMEPASSQIIGSFLLSHHRNFRLPILNNHVWTLALNPGTQTPESIALIQTGYLKCWLEITEKSCIESPILPLI